MTSSCCNGTRLQLGGWMGPTAEAPYPDPCPVCSPNMTPRAIQVAQAEWLHDNADREDVKQILARRAVMAGTYARVLLVPGFDLPRDEAAKADIVIGPDGTVVKDRYGVAGYRLSETEVRRIRDDAEVVVRVGSNGSVMVAS